MAVEKYSIGGTVTETETFEAFADIPQNRVLLAEQLTAEPAAKCKIVQGLTSVESVFEAFKPKVEVDFENEEGGTKKEMLHFNGLGDFGIKGITNQSSFLSELTVKKEQYQKVVKQLKSNKLLQKALKNSDTKQSLINSLQALIKELEAAK